MPAEEHLEGHIKAESGGEIAPEEIRAALEKALASEAFAKVERPARFMRHLVETTLRGETHLLKESVLGSEIFGRPTAWDPRLDPVVRQEAARLRKRLVKYRENGGARAEIIIDLPVSGYVPVFERRPAEPEAATPEIVSTPPPPPVAPLPIEIPSAAPVLAVPPRKRWWPMATAAVVMIVAAVVMLRVAFRPESQLSIAVLPFTNLTGEPANEYFSAGLTDEITDSLARIKSLRIIARSSAAQFQGKKVDVREVGRKLNVTHVLEGSVERSGDQVKVIAHLERASDGSLLWSNVYERKAADLYAIQSELAAGIAGSLKVATGVEKTKHVPKPEAFELALRARYDMQELTMESLARAEEGYRKAVAIDPEYAAAYLSLGNIMYDRFAARGSAVQNAGERKTAEQLFHKALELDPDLPPAHAMLAILAMQYQWDWAGAERELGLALSGPANASAESQYALFLVFRGRFAEADQHIRRVLELDPYSTASMNNTAIARNLEGRFAEVRDIAQRMAAAYPKVLSPRQAIGLTYIEEGQPELAFPFFRPLEARFPPIAIFEAMAAARSGDRAGALRLMRPFEEKAGAGVTNQWFALAYGFMGDEANTVKWLERSADAHEWQALNMAVHPVFAPMRKAPAFRALLHRMGLDR